MLGDLPLAMTSKRHFKTFDALRFLAFLKVFLHHTPPTDCAAFNYAKIGGSLGVRFFFVLSGFLITYIILEEKQQTGRLDVKHFIVRRILRIWPLYYAIIAFAYASPYILTLLHLESSNEGYAPQLAYSLTFLENYRTMIERTGANVSPLPVIWSVCVEEHFYIVWGLLLYYLDARHLPKIIASCVAIALASRVLFTHLGYASLDLLTNLDLCALGALPAYFLITRKDKCELAINRIGAHYKILFMMVVFAVVVVAPHYTGTVATVGMPLVFAILFAALLSIFLPEKSRFQIGDQSVFSKLGKYTYAMYLLHTVIILLLIRLGALAGLSFDRLESVGEFAVFFSVSLGLTILASVVSYVVLEGPCLRLRKRFY